MILAFRKEFWAEMGAMMVVWGTFDVLIGNDSGNSFIGRGLVFLAGAGIWWVVAFLADHLEWKS